MGETTLLVRLLRRSHSERAIGEPRNLSFPPVPAREMPRQAGVSCLGLGSWSLVPGNCSPPFVVVVFPRLPAPRESKAASSRRTPKPPGWPWPAGRQQRRRSLRHGRASRGRAFGVRRLDAAFHLRGALFSSAADAQAARRPLHQQEGPYTTAVASLTRSRRRAMMRRVPARSLPDTRRRAPMRAVRARRVPACSIAPIASSATSPTART